MAFVGHALDWVPSGTIALFSKPSSVDSGLSKPLSSECRAFTQVNGPALGASGVGAGNQFHGQLQIN